MLNGLLNRIITSGCTISTPRSEDINPDGNHIMPPRHSVDILVITPSSAIAFGVCFIPSAHHWN